MQNLREIGVDREDRVRRHHGWYPNILVCFTLPARGQEWSACPADVTPEAFDPAE
jgi:hypothetical protein